MSPRSLGSASPARPIKAPTRHPLTAVTSRRYFTDVFAVLQPPIHLTPPTLEVTVYGLFPWPSMAFACYCVEARHPPNVMLCMPRRGRWDSVGPQFISATRWACFHRPWLAFLCQDQGQLFALVLTPRSIG